MSYLLRKRGDEWKREIQDRPRPRRKVRVIRTRTVEPYLNDYAFFAIAPLYVHAGVEYSMPDQFELEAGEQDRLIVDYQRTVIGGLGRWGRFVEGIHQSVWEDFCHYLGTVMFFSHEKQVVWQIRAQDINVEGTTQSAVFDSRRLPVRLRVLLPDGNRRRMFVKGGYPAKLWWDKPHPRMVAAAQAILSCRGRIDGS